MGRSQRVRQRLHEPPHLHGQLRQRGDGHMAALAQPYRAGQPHLQLPQVEAAKHGHQLQGGGRPTCGWLVVSWHWQCW
jgi:hypothetical protein